MKALNRIGATQTMEDFISFTLAIASNTNEPLRPVYGVVPTDSLEERTTSELKGYRGDGPVRVGNAAAQQSQHDTYGSVILAALPMFYDRRLPRLGDQGLFELLETLGEKARTLAFEADNGIWEYRGRRRAHAFDRDVLGRLSAACGHCGPARAHRASAYWNAVAEPMHQTLLEGAWNPKRGAFTAAFGSDEPDASVPAARSWRHRGRRPAVREHRRRHGARTSTRNTLCVTRRRMILGCRRPRF